MGRRKAEPGIESLGSEAAVESFGMKIKNLIWEYSFDRRGNPLEKEEWP